MSHSCHDNLMLLPASQLPNLGAWRSLSNGLPPGTALLVIPSTNTPLKTLMTEVAAILSAGDRHVATVKPPT